MYFVYSDFKGPKSIWRLGSTACTRFPPPKAYVTQLIIYCRVNYNQIICLPFLLTIDHFIVKGKKSTNWQLFNCFYLNWVIKVFFLYRYLCELLKETYAWNRRLFKTSLPKLEIICTILLIEMIGHCYFNRCLRIGNFELIIISKPRHSERVTPLSCVILLIVGLDWRKWTISIVHAFFKNKSIARFEQATFRFLTPHKWSISHNYASCLIF